MPNTLNRLRATLVMASLFSTMTLGASQASPAGNSSAPKPAPSFKHNQNVGSDSRPSFAVNTSAKRTLEGNVKKDGLDGVAMGTGAMLTGGANIFENGATQRPSSTSVPPDTYRGWLEKTHPQFALNVGMSPKDSLIEVKGQWDDAARTLRNLGIPFTRVRAGQVRPEILANAKVLVINCAGELHRDQLQGVRDFVSNGGYLLTTDWSLNNMLEQTFPGFIEWNRAKSGHNMYSSTIVNPDPVLFSNTVRNAYWKLDLSAHLIHIRRPESVRVICTSQELAMEDPDSMGILAVVFKFGKGYVLHMVGHFDNNSGIAIGNLLPDPAPGIGISLRQAIATNFVVAGLTKTPIPMGGKR